MTIHLGNAALFPRKNNFTAEGRRVTQRNEEAHIYPYSAILSGPLR